MLGPEFGCTGPLRWNLRRPDICEKYKPFTIVGILEKTGTPVDRTLQIGLAGIEALHLDWQEGSRSALTIDAEQALRFDLTPTSITAFMVGLENRSLTFRVQRDINDFAAEPMSAIIPGATLAEFWRTISAIEQVLCCRCLCLSQGCSAC